MNALIQIRQRRKGEGSNQDEFGELYKRKQKLVQRQTSSNDGPAFLPSADIFKVYTGSWLELLGRPMGQAGRRVSETDLPRLLSQLSP